MTNPSYTDEQVLDRFVVLKVSGSRFAYVNDTLEGRTVKRYDVLKNDGWAKAERHAATLNAEARATPNETKEAKS